MTYDIFLMRVMHRTGLDDSILAQELTHHVVGLLGGCLHEETAQEVAEHLAEPLGARLVEERVDRSLSLGGIYRSVAKEYSVELSFGLEFTQVVFQVLGEAVGPKMRELLREDLPEEWHLYFEPRTVSSGRYIHRDRHQRNLASGQPGSSRPLSEARPGHRNSIAHRQRP